MSNTNAQKVAEDVSERAHQMPRGSALLYRNKTPKNSTSPHYLGLTKLPNGEVYWIGLWVRGLGAIERVLEVKFVPKE